MLEAYMHAFVKYDHFIEDNSGRNPNPDYITEHNILNKPM